MTVANLAVLGVLLISVVAFGLVLRPGRASTLEFYLAGRRVGVVTNAWAICGDYFSAASFLGVAAAVYASGLDGVWYATGFAAGFVPVLLFIAAPLRRFGEFSMPDFLGRRFNSDKVRLVAVTLVQLIILSYLVPQAVGSGLTWELLVGDGMFGMSAYATGVVVSTVAITALVVVGGMRGTTWTQALQFLMLLAVFVWLAVVVLASGFDYAGAVGDIDAEPLANPAYTDGQWQLQPDPNRLEGGEPAYFGKPGGLYGPLGQLTLMVTLIMGTAGLPHVMNRYFTSPTGTAARMTTLWVLGFAGLFYALAVLLGTAARSIIATEVDGRPWLGELTVDGVLRVPEHAPLVLGRIFGGEAGLGVVAIGALVAVLSTIAGLLLAAAASWGHDVYERHINPGATQRQAVRAGRVAVIVVAMLSAAFALALRPVSLSSLFPSIVAAMVTWAFALAGSALAPVLILAIWWRGTTARGAIAGMVTGGVTAIGMLVSAASISALVGPGRSVAEVLLTPTIVAAPLAVAVTVLVSRRTRPPDDLDRLWLKLHGTAGDRRAVQLARLTVTGINGARTKAARSQRSRRKRAGEQS